MKVDSRLPSPPASLHSPCSRRGRRAHCSRRTVVRHLHRLYCRGADLLSDVVPSQPPLKLINSLGNRCYSARGLLRQCTVTAGPLADATYLSTFREEWARARCRSRRDGFRAGTLPIFLLLQPSVSGDPAMSMFRSPFDAPQTLSCGCGRHTSQAEHDIAATPLSLEDSRGRVLEAAVMRAVFPRDAERRRFLQIVGAGSAYGILSSIFPFASLQARADGKKPLG